MFYDKFKYLCDGKGVSCNKAALEMGLSNATPTKWKKTGATPDGTTLAKIANYFGVSISYLLSTEENADAIINDISQYQAIISWTVEQDDVPDRVKDVIQSELPGNTMAPLAALSYQAGAHYSSGAKEKPTPVSEGGLSERDIRVAMWFRSLPPETQKAILTLGDGPKDLVE